MVQSEAESRPQVVHLDIIADRRGLLRAEATSNLGIHLMSMALRGPEVIAIFPRDRTYFSGHVRELQRRQTLPIPFNPQWIFYMLFDLEPPRWSCQKDAQGLPSICQHPSGPHELRWTERQGNLKTVRLVSAQSQFQLQVRSVESKDELNPDLFQINPPASFRSVEL